MEHHGHGHIELVEIFADAVHDKRTVEHAALDDDFVNAVARRDANFDFDRLGPLGKKLKAAGGQLIASNVSQLRGLMVEQAIGEKGEHPLPIGSRRKVAISGTIGAISRIGLIRLMTRCHGSPRASGVARQRCPIGHYIALAYSWHPVTLAEMR